MKYIEIKNALKEPVSQDLISHLSKGGASIPFINVTDYKDLLDDRTGGMWEAQILDYKQIGNELCVTVRLFIHADDGIFSQDGNGLEKVDFSGYGDTFSNAYAQAFRRACESHGLSRELWRKEEHETKPANVSRPQSNGTGKITEKQEKFIFDLCNQTNSLSPKVASHFSNNRTDKVEDLTFAEASKAIEGLKAKLPTN